jgi:transcriptional regulator
MPRDVVDAVQGTLEILILRALAWGELYGYALARWILERSGEELRIEEGTLYPALRRMDNRGAIEAAWGVSELGRRAKFYRLTSACEAELKKRVSEWYRYTGAVARLLESPQEGA